MLLLTSMIFSTAVFSQVAINTDGSTVNSSAMLDVKSTTKGFLPPRMTQAQVTAISEPAEGLMVYCTDCAADGNGTIMLYQNSAWRAMSFGSLPAAPVEAAETGITASEITWNWTVGSDVTGSRWNTANDYTSATDMSATVTKTETGLDANTAYTRYVWSYNAYGHSAATSLTATTSAANNACNNQTTVTYDGGGNTYNIVAIGDQCWMAENLHETPASGSYYSYPGVAAYGYYYEWAALGITTPGDQGLCPDGWHLATDSDFASLLTYTWDTYAGDWLTVLRSNTDDWGSGNEGSNATGFNARPAGYHYDYGSEFNNVGSDANFWAPGEGANPLHTFRIITVDYSTQYDDDYNSRPIRCVKNSSK